MRAPDLSSSGILAAIELATPGKHEGHFALLHSDNQHPLGVHMIPAMSIVGGDGPSVLLLGGVHGDEYEGPVALMRLFQALSPKDISGRLLFLPMANAPAARAGTRCSPLDGGNLNRAFPGDPKGPPTAQIAHLISACLMPAMDAVIDLHAGGKASWFVPSALAARGLDGGLAPANMELATAFGAEVIWVLQSGPGVTSVNGAATQRGVTCIAAELGGAGRVGVAPLAVAETGLRRCLAHLGVIAGPPPEAPAAAPRRVELGPAARVVTPVSGIYQPARAAGRDIATGEILGWVVSMERPSEPPAEIRATATGLIFAETARGPVTPGDFIAFIASDLNGEAFEKESS